MENGGKIWFPDIDFIEEMLNEMVSVLFPNYEDGTPDFQYLGGLHGRGLLESALAQPQQTFAGKYLYPSIPEMAAALIWSVTKNHPFNDGNKRAALTTGILFLAFNGYILLAGRNEAVELCLRVAASEPEIDRAYVSDWIKERLVELRNIQLLYLMRDERILRYEEVASADEIIEFGRALQGIRNILAEMQDPPEGQVR